eukprot:3937163-Rhodomonas_salina.1
MESRLTDNNIDDLFSAWALINTNIHYIPFQDQATPQCTRRSYAPRILLLHPFFYTLLCGNHTDSDKHYDFSNTRHLLNNISIDYLEQIVFGIHQPAGIGHWTVADVQLTTHCITHLNSTSSSEKTTRAIANNIVRWWNDFARSKLRNTLATNRPLWNTPTCRSPKQILAHDC